MLKKCIDLGMLGFWTVTLLGLFAACGDNLDKIGQPCAGGVDGDLVCTPSFSVHPTWEKPCLDHRECPKHVPCLFPPQGIGGFGVCDVGHRWFAYYGASSTYYDEYPLYYYEEWYYEDPWYTYGPNYWLGCYDDYDCYLDEFCDYSIGLCQPLYW